MGIVDRLKKSAGAGDDYSDYNSDNEYYSGLGGDQPYDDNNGYGGDYGPVVDDSAVDDGGYEQQSGPYTAPRASASMNISGAVEMKVVRPEHFDSVTQIAEHLLAHRSVVLNLENTNKETARRLIDFLSGVAFSIDGKLKRITATTYIITPDNVDVEEDASFASRDKASQTDRPKKPQSAPAGMADEFAEF